jgi:hypothetical protein
MYRLQVIDCAAKTCFDAPVCKYYKIRKTSRFLCLLRMGRRSYHSEAFLTTPTWAAYRCIISARTLPRELTEYSPLLLSRLTKSLSFAYETPNHPPSPPPAHGKPPHVYWDRTYRPVLRDQTASHHASLTSPSSHVPSVEGLRVD